VTDVRQQVQIVDEDHIVGGQGVPDDAVEGLFQGERMPVGGGVDQVADAEHRAAEAGAGGVQNGRAARPAIPADHEDVPDRERRHQAVERAPLRGAQRLGRLGPRPRRRSDHAW
jgi:hypothetical protein